MVYNQTRVTVRIDYTMREHIAQIQLVKPYAKLSVLIRCALRAYLRDQVDKINQQNMEAASLDKVAGPLSISQDQDNAVIAAGEILLTKPRRSKKGKA